MSGSKRTSFVSDILTLSSVPIISQVLGLLLTPIVTRLYSPETFGLFNVFGTIVTLIAVLSTMGYHGAIILPKRIIHVHYILILCLLCTMVITVVSATFILSYKEYIILQIGTPEIANYLWIVPLSILLHGIYQTLRYLNIRLHNFKNLAFSRVNEIVARKIYQLTAGALGNNTTASLIYAGLFANILKDLILFRGIDFKYINIMNFASKKKYYIKLWVISKRYKKFPLYSVWGELLSRLPEVMVSILIIKYFGKEVLGNYGLSIMVLALPSALVSGSLVEAFSPRVAMAKHENKHTALMEKLYIPLVAIVIYPFMVLAIYSDSIFPLIFGTEWFQAGVIAKIMVLRFLLEVIFNPALTLIDIMEKQEIHVIRSISRCVIVMTSICLGVYYENIYISLWCLSIGESFLTVIIGVYIMKQISFPIKKTIHESSKYLISCAIILILSYVTWQYLDDNQIILLIIIFISSIIYYGLILNMNTELSKLVKQKFARYKP